jgi:hypothetical protein
MNNLPAETECPWESGALGASFEHAAPAPESLGEEVDEALALQLISIRLPRKLIADLKLIADREGLGYQPLARRVLMRFVEAEFRAMAHERLVSTMAGQNGCTDTSIRKTG